jgi:uncharacterized protein
MTLSTVLASVPVSDVCLTRDFYRDVLGVSVADPADGIVVVELPHLSVFLIDRAEFERYAHRAGASEMPKTSPYIFSCAFTERDDVDTTIARAAEFGVVTVSPEQHEGSYVGYVHDPDSHIWELVWNERTQSSSTSTE